MDLEGNRDISAPRETVWARLNDPQTLMQCIPGCEELSGSPAEGFSAVVKQKVGPVRATFKGAVVIEDANAPESYRLVGEGKGGVAGFAKGEAGVTLTETGTGTQLAYNARIQVGGKLAQLGNRIIGGFARKMTDSFFTRFEAICEGRDPDAENPDADDSQGHGATPDSGTDEPRR